MLIGIDPGKQTGVCIYDKNIIELFTCKFWDVIEIIEKSPSSFFILEKPKTKHVWHSAKNIKQAKVIGANVGSVCREAELIEQYLILKKLSYAVNHPIGKLNAKEFKRISSYGLQTNQHERDAAMLCINFSKKYFHI